MLLLTPISGQALNCYPRACQSSPRAKGPRAGLTRPRATILMPALKWGSAISQCSLPTFCPFLQHPSRGRRLFQLFTLEVSRFVFRKSVRAILKILSPRNIADWHASQNDSAISSQYRTAFIEMWCEDWRKLV